MKISKLFLVLSIIFTISSLFAQTPFEVSARFIDAFTGSDYNDVSNIQFEVELDPPSGDIQLGPTSICTVNIDDVGTGFQSSFVQFDLANFTNAYQTDSIIRVKIWATQNPNGFAEVTYQKDIDLDPAGGLIGWTEWFGVGGYPLEVDPAPVFLSSFTTVFANQFVQINWITQSESNNLGWNIYRGLSNNHGQALQINLELIPGAGTSSEPVYYFFYDEYVEINTTYWYWLECVTYSGESALFGPITITVIDDPNIIPDLPTETRLHGIYPNPFN